MPAGSAIVPRFNTVAETCGGLASDATGCCFADFDSAAGVTINDIFAYLNAWFAGSPYAKWEGDGVSPSGSIQDVFTFLNAWFAGCG